MATTVSDTVSHINQTTKLPLLPEHGHTSLRAAGAQLLVADAYGKVPAERQAGDGLIGRCGERRELG